jgi:hypothetical protein
MFRILHYNFQAIATFNTNAYDEALMYVNDMAEVSFDADLLICQVVQVSIDSGSCSAFETDCSALRASGILLRRNGTRCLKE